MPLIDPQPLDPNIIRRLAEHGAKRECFFRSVKNPDDIDLKDAVVMRVWDDKTSSWLNVTMKTKKNWSDVIKPFTQKV